MRIEIVKNFITQKECEQLNAWVDEGVEKKWLDLGISNFIHGYKKRVTTRLYPERFEYPDFVLNLSNRIRTFCNIQDRPLITGHGNDIHGRNGIVVSCTFPGGDVYPHRDPPSKDGLSTLRCNIQTRKADSGAQLYVGGIPVNIECGDLHCYLVSEFQHYVTPVEGNTSRVLWMFGAYVPAEDWENETIKLNR